MTVRVELVSGRGTDFHPPPGRVFVVGPNTTFGDLADAIDLHFARWDMGHLHVFRLEDGRQIGYPDPEFPDWLDHESVTVFSAVSKATNSNTSSTSAMTGAIYAGWRRLASTPRRFRRRARVADPDLGVGIHPGSVRTSNGEGLWRGPLEVRDQCARCQ